MANISIYETYNDCLEELKGNRIFAVTTKATKYYGDFKYKKGDVFVFGPETRGLPVKILNGMLENEKIRVPMVKDNRSLNLSNTVAIVLYEAWRQINFESGI
jgi:tRNA (cytidine/uridine-2'-O-)-methyltransferase